MIVKVKVTEDIWEFFDGVRRFGKQIHYPDQEVGAAKDFSKPDIGVRSDFFDFVDRPCTEDERKGGLVELWLYGKDLHDIRQILAYRPVYLLNDSGETIERI
uniref:Uncharacterized protein n=1 Tax=viral metagenome TaxID=1070528 RepID=A0A6M3M324_9ZZZZ